MRDEFSPLQDSRMPGAKKLQPDFESEQETGWVGKQKFTYSYRTQGLEGSQSRGREQMDKDTGSDERVSVAEP